jgi:hypothetical protein
MDGDRQATVRECRPGSRHSLLPGTGHLLAPLPEHHDCDQEPDARPNEECGEVTHSQVSLPLVDQLDAVVRWVVGNTRSVSSLPDSIVQISHKEFLALDLVPSGEEQRISPRLSSANDESRCCDSSSSLPVSRRLTWCRPCHRPRSPAPPPRPSAWPRRRRPSPLRSVSPCRPWASAPASPRARRPR